MITGATFKLSNSGAKTKWVIAIVIFLVLLASLVFLIFYQSGKQQKLVSPLGEEIKSVQKLKDEPKTANPLNGIPTPLSEAKNWSNRYILGVMVENLSITRPQTGLGRADLVYEALTEGEITRFMGVYLSENTDLGPVRSVRAPFLHWLSEYDGAIAHIGGSSEALDQIGPLKIKDLDGGNIGAPTFVRIDNRGLALEHTVFSNTQKIWEVTKKLGYRGLKPFTSWKFKDEVEVKNRPATEKLTLKFTGNKDYIVTWDYNTETNDYFRSNGGKPHLDQATGEVLKAKNVIVQFIKTTPDEVSPGKLGRKMDTLGGGQVLIFRDGVFVKGVWEKKTPWSRTRFLDNTGNEIELNRGKIWVEVNPIDNAVEYN